MAHTYRIEYAPPGQRSIVRTHRTMVPLERGKWVIVDGTYLVVERLIPGRICHAGPGDEHVAHPAPAARILVIERKGSI